MRHLLPLILLASAVTAQDSFLEEFALAPDRGAVLERLVPGTADAYFFTALERQHAGDLDSVDALIEPWEDAHPRDRRRQVIERRQLLLRAGEDPGSTFEQLIDDLDLRFDHEPTLPGQAAEIPTTLDPELLDHEALVRAELKRRRGNLDNFETSELRSLATRELTSGQRRDLLNRLRTPDVPGLVELVLAELDHDQSKGFGSLGVHRRLLLEQLDALAAARPSLLSVEAFVQAYLDRLVPGSHQNWREDVIARRNFALRLESFARRLPPVFNELRSEVLGWRLLLDLEQGRPNRALFLEWLRIPRRGSWVNRDHVDGVPSREIVGDAPQAWTPLGALDTRALVTDHLAAFLPSDATTADYEPFLEGEFLARHFAEFKLMSGDEDVERWVSMLGGPEKYADLQRRVEIRFPRTVPRHFDASAPVTIDVELKAVGTLLVKVFEIDAAGWYRAKGTEIDARLPLDGLVAGGEQTYTYDDNPVLRVQRRFEFPQLARPGTFVIEFIGGGLSSRVVIEKGRLQLHERTSAAGHAFRVFDERGVPASDASLWFGGRTYTADDDGEIRVPFTSDPGLRKVVLSAKGRTTLEQFQHVAESYHLTAGVLVEPESLVGGETAPVLVRPVLRCAGEPIDLALLENVSLEMEIRRADGVVVSRRQAIEALRDDEELVTSLEVPEVLTRLRVRLHGSIDRMSDGKPVQISSSWVSYRRNEIEPTSELVMPMLTRSAAGWRLEMRGRGGEPLADEIVDFQFFRTGVRRPVTTRLRTDVAGRIRLGRLGGVATLVAESRGGVANGSSWWWSLQDEEPALPGALQGYAGNVARVSCNAQRLDRSVAGLYEVSGDALVRDCFRHLALQDGALEVRGLAPGDYLLRVGSEDYIPLTVENGTLHGDWVVGRERHLQLSDTDPLRITSSKIEGEDLVVTLAGASPSTRVHVTSTHFDPGTDRLGRLGAGMTSGLESAAYRRAFTQYAAGRTLSDEYRYVLERRFAETFPGNMLARPTLLLNPWSTDTWNSVIGVGGGAGGKFGGRGGGRRNLRAAGGSGSEQAFSSRDPRMFVSYEFLASGAPLLSNLRPDDQGVLRVPLSSLGSGGILAITAVDQSESCTAEVLREGTSLARKDRRLDDGLPGNLAFAERRRIEALSTGDEVSIALLGGGEGETFETLADVFAYLEPGLDKLIDFEFLLSWPEYTFEQKARYYGGHACHEMHLFLWNRDPQFFEQVVRPYLENKFEKTFIDEWLLERDLTRYLDPWAFKQLNLVERILLARRFPDNAKDIARGIADRVQLDPTEDEELADLLESALASRAMDPGLVTKGMKKMAPADKRAFIEPSEDAAALEPVLEEMEAAEFDLEDEDSIADSPFDDKAFNSEIGTGGGLKQDAKARDRARQLYVESSDTQVYLEQNYYQRRRGEGGGDWIPTSEFWLDFAQTAPDEPFLSPYFVLADSTSNEALLALALLDLPFKASEHSVVAGDGRLRFTAAGPVVLVSKDLVQVDAPSGNAGVMVAQDLFDMDRRHEIVDGEEIEVPISGDLVRGRRYVARVVATNPSSRTRDLDLLVQIPEGAISLAGRPMTQGLSMSLPAYASRSFEYGFYFPMAGQFEHTPARASSNGEALVATNARTLVVLDEPSEIDGQSWEYISQQGTREELLPYLVRANLSTINLDRIRWRMRDAGMFDEVLQILRSRFHYDSNLWSYALHHQDARAAREFMSFQSRYLAGCGPVLSSPLVDIDPVERGTYEHVEFWPLFHARQHPFRGARTVDNAGVRQQWTSFLEVLAYTPRPSDEDWLAATYGLLLQDRVREGLDAFARVDADQVEARMQYDYTRAYLDFYSDDHALARSIAEPYLEHPVPRWRERFQEVIQHLDEAEGRTETDLVAGSEDPVDGEPSLELVLEGDEVLITSEGLAECELRFHPMDVEFLFSTSPFVQQEAGAFGYVMPAARQTVQLGGARARQVSIPADYQNVWVEVRGGGLTRRLARYQSDFVVQILETRGQVKVTHRETGEPLQEVYVKVYAQDSDGARFHKDGYTDLRGRFDYTSVSGRSLSGVTRFSLLVLSPEHGAVIREVKPPQR